ncbi:MAG TPA: ATP-dependent sacrificial sulfur transferase LarE [Candidatus Latescibacteria bacterium]|nr:ATP-dependent sacrificial sulfur transferase LarE [Candidatus Latescibacterota bacterium]
MTLEEKHARLREMLLEASPVVVAFSGGVDSTFLLAAAHRALGKGKCIGVTAVSESLAPAELDEARQIANQIGAEWTTIQTREMDDPLYRANTKERCYFCKTELFSALRTFAHEHGFATVLDGFNADDTGDWRPGARAGAEQGVKSPLKDAGLTKQDIRDLSRSYGLPTWNKPSFACLASRLPYNTEITPERLALIAAAEAALRSHGFMAFRARYHGETARLEIGIDEILRFEEATLARSVRDAVVKAGFARVTLDLAGFRSGSQNETSGGSGIVPLPSAARDGLSIVRKKGLSGVETRTEGNMIRIIVSWEDFRRILKEETRVPLVVALRGQGYVYVAADIP